MSSKHTHTATPPRARPIQYKAHHGTRWEKEKASVPKGTFDFPDDPTTIGQWIIGECVGKGASGRVKVARNSVTGQMAAVKILPLEAVLSSRMSLRTKENKLEKHRNSIDKEIIMMKLMCHPNIVRIVDVFEGEKELYLILEYVEGGELFDYLVNNGKMDPLKALMYFKQIICGLSYAHAFSIIHRDLKPENILIESLDPPRVKIADWGMAALAPPSHQLETSCGSPHYASPEIVNGKRYAGGGSDIWSCGVILFALLTGRLPFDDKNIKVLLTKVKNGKFDIPSYVFPQAADLIRRILIVDVEKRITMDEILAHPFMQHDTPGLVCIPAPSIAELARPIRSRALIRPDLLRSLEVIWGQSSTDELVAELTNPSGEGSLVKALYFLLNSYREKRLEEYGMLDFSLDPESSIRHYAAPPPKPANSSIIESGIRTIRAAPAPPTRVITTFEFTPSAQSSPKRSPAGPRFPHTPTTSRPGTPTSATPLGPKSRPLSTPNPYTELQLSQFRDLITQPPPNSRRPKPTRAMTTAVDGMPLVPPSPRDKDEYDFCTPVTPKVLATRTLSYDPSNATSPLRPVVEAPQVKNPELQRAIDDIAGRFLDLVEKNNAARIEAAGYSAGHNSLPPVFTPRRIHNNVDEREPIWHKRDGDKENIGAFPIIRPKPEYDLEMGNAYGKVPRKTRPPMFDLHNSRQHDDEVPLVASPPPSSPAVVGEFKGWFSNLFNWKAQQYVLHSVDNFVVMREEVSLLLESFGIHVMLEDGNGWGVLRCRVDEQCDFVSGNVTMKPVRFRVEFSPVLGYSQTTSRNTSNPPPRSRGSQDRPLLARTNTKNITPWASMMVMIQEKGALSTFKMVYQRLRAEWRLEALQSPDAGGATPIMGPVPKLLR